MDPIPIELVAAETDEGVRVDVFLRDRLPGCSRAHLRREIGKGHVIRNGRPIRKGDLLRAGDRIDLRALCLVDETPIAPDPSGPLVVLLETPDLVVVSKEAGLPTLPKGESDTRALACRLVARYPELLRVGPPFEAGLLHRLDTETSGLLAAARTRDAYEALREQWRWRRVEKAYLALVEGEARASFTMLMPIAHHPKSRKKMAVSKEGRSAETRCRSLFVSPRSSLLLVHLREGRRHQIRVHLASAGHPVRNDPLYSKRGTRGGRLMLHALRLRFLSPRGSERIDVVDPPPAAFVEIVERELGQDAVRSFRRALRARSREGGA
ncbi:MAG: RluA family pseudouridine synthase [Candidatus Eisenbacteria bacterium]|nr:RluA family pseudouridine synthase [Candidatus Eisenbacteria bacterium]